MISFLSSKKAAHSAAFFLSILIIAFIYYPGIDSGFYFDDISNLQGLSNLNDTGIMPFIFENVTRRPISYLTFIPHQQAWISGNGSEVKLINLLIHLFNTVLVFLLARQLIRAFKIPSKHTTTYATWISLIWAINPIHVNTVLYSIQRMTLLSASFSLVSLVYFLEYAKHERTNRQWLVAGVLISVLIVLGILSKENAILSCGYLLVLSQTSALKNRPALLWWQALFAMLPLALTIFYLFYTDKFNDSYRDFSLFERLLSQSIILFEYIKNILLPFPANISLFHDGYSPVTLSKNPWSLVTLIIWPLTFMACSIAIKKLRQPNMKAILAFSLLFFMVGHLLESTGVNLELYFEHRNYIPSFAILFFTVIFTFTLFKKSPLLAHTILILLCLNMATTTYIKAKQWGSPKDFALSNLKDNPNSIRSHQIATTYYLSQGDIYSAIKLIDHMDRNIKAYTSNKLRLIYLQCFLTSQSIKPIDSGILSVLKTSSNDPYIARQITDIYTLIANDKCPNISYSNFKELITTLLNNPNVTFRNSQSLLIGLAITNIHLAAYQDATSTLQKIHPTNNINTSLLTIQLLLDLNKTKLAKNRFKQLKKSMTKYQSWTHRKKIATIESLLD